MKAATYYWFEGVLPHWLAGMLLRAICRRKGHDPSPGPVVTPEVVCPGNRAFAGGASGLTLI